MLFCLSPAVIFPIFGCVFPKWRKQYCSNEARTAQIVKSRTVQHRLMSHLASFRSRSSANESNLCSFYCSLVFIALVFLLVLIEIKCKWNRHHRQTSCIKFLLPHASPPEKILPCRDQFILNPKIVQYSLQNVSFVEKVTKKRKSQKNKLILQQNIVRWDKTP